MTSAALFRDLCALLDHVGERGVVLTDTGRLRIADVRAINARFDEPEELDRRFGEHVHRVRSEDEAWRVHFLRLAAQAAGLLDARRGRLRRTARAGHFARRAPEDGVRDLLVAWWWKGAWDLLVPPGALQLLLMRDRAATADALLELGAQLRPLEAFGAGLRRSLAPALPASVGPALDDEAWAYAAWHVALEPLAAASAARATHTVEEIVEGHPFERMAAIGLTDDGVALLRHVVEARPVTPPRVRRGMRSSYPLPRGLRIDADDVTALAEDERRERILREHPEYDDAMGRGAERVGETNPRAHLALHEGIESQLASGEPPEVRGTYERLLALGYDRHTVIHGLAYELAQEIWASQRADRRFDSGRYVARLATLPRDDTAADDGVREPLPPARLAAADRRKLLALPRSVAVWEGDLTDLPVEVADMGAPSCAIWVDTNAGVVRAIAPAFDTAPSALLLASFVSAALRPSGAAPGLPARVRVHPELATALRPALAELAVGVEEAEELAAAHDALDSLAQFLLAPEPSGPRAGRRARRRRSR